ncbi:hypothetical protein BT93_L3458 [Corymbia citriodora subsp. variegata]|uniref:Uncharacterized protein n=1 Tax=Corymbia citriodora subsp. variegata TaxID=360336 RepID=A0A8T0CWW7_CORYI|nr:hypothetical protein BT93_L3458 [Corymbia citriodora subsp. variegata]
MIKEAIMALNKKETAKPLSKPSKKTEVAAKKSKKLVMAKAAPVPQAQGQIKSEERAESELRGRQICRKKEREENGKEKKPENKRTRSEREERKKLREPDPREREGRRRCHSTTDDEACWWLAPLPSPPSSEDMQQESSSSRTASRSRRRSRSQPLGHLDAAADRRCPRCHPPLHHPVGGSCADHRG